MITVIIDIHSEEAIKMLEYLKTKKYAKVLDEREPNEVTNHAINEVKEGKVKTYKSVKDMITSLTKAADVQD